MGACLDYIQRIYGFRLETVERVQVLAAGVVAQVLLNDPNRVNWTIFNLGANVCTAAFSNNVAAAFGIQIAAAGGTVGSNAREDGELPARALFGFSAAGTTLYIVETRQVM